MARLATPLVHSSSFFPAKYLRGHCQTANEVDHANEDSSQHHLLLGVDELMEDVYEGRNGGFHDRELVKREQVVFKQLVIERLLLLLSFTSDPKPKANIMMKKSTLKKGAAEPIKLKPSG